MKLHGTKTCWYTHQVQLAADLVGVKCDVTDIGPEDAKKEAFFEKSPLGIIPTLETNTGYVFGAAAAARFFGRLRPDMGACGSGFQQAAEVEGWMGATSDLFELPLIALMMAEEGSETSSLKERCMTFLSAFNKHLENNTFVVGERITVADIFILAPLVHALALLDKRAVLTMRHICRWGKTILASSPGVKRVVGDVKFEAPPPEKKKDINALDALPPSSFVMDEWKRCYSNTKDLYGAAMTWFWDNFDAEGWSLWFMEYEKLEGECTVSFVTSNQLGGFLQRMDNNLRKHTFAVLQILGHEGDYNYSGVWLMRGSEIPLELREHPSFEYHKFRKVDPVTEKDVIAKFWCEEESINGLPVVDCKVWK